MKSVFDLTFSSRLASPPRDPEWRSRKTSSSRVCRTTSAGVRGLDLKRPFILAPSSAAASAEAEAGGTRGGEGKGEAAGLLRPPDPKEKQPRKSATGPAAVKASPTPSPPTPPPSLLRDAGDEPRRDRGGPGEIVTRSARARRRGPRSSPYFPIHPPVRAGGGSLGP
uniref:Uncharacterized protein n=1 Tax=Oryza brachyantha TaxID=4533 RepID=J3MMG5_ORYBR